MKLRAEIVGTRYFDKRPVTVTDPCYDSCVWCKIDGVKVKEGLYSCVVWRAKRYYTKNETNERQYYDRVYVCGIYLDEDFSQDKVWDGIGSIGVDAGLAGFYQDKPNYSDEAWEEFCLKLRGKDHLITNEGFCTQSGDGDGLYPVYVCKDENGDVIGLEIHFH